MAALSLRHFTTHRFGSADNSKTGQRWQAELFHQELKGKRQDDKQIAHDWRSGLRSSFDARRTLHQHQYTAPINTESVKATASQMYEPPNNPNAISIPPKIMEVTFISKDAHRLRPNLSHLSKSITSDSTTEMINVRTIKARCIPLALRSTPTVHLHRMELNKT